MLYLCWLWRWSELYGRVGVFGESGCSVLLTELKSSLAVDFKFNQRLSFPPSFCLSGCLVDWQPRTAFSPFTTQWSVSVPKWRGSPFPKTPDAPPVVHSPWNVAINHVAAVASGLAVNLLVCLWNGGPSVSICTQTGSSMKGSATTSVCVCVCVCEVDVCCHLSTEGRRRKNRHEAGWPFSIQLDRLLVTAHLPLLI